MPGTPSLESAEIAATQFLGRPPYQDLLRALGHLIDQEGWREVLIIEKPWGFVVCGSPANPRIGEPAARRFPHAELSRLVRDARRQRGRGRAQAPVRRSRLAALRERPDLAGVGRFSMWLDSGSYETRLRAVGWLADTARVEQVRVREEGETLVVHGRRIDAPDAEEPPARLTPRNLQQVLTKMGRLRDVETWSVPRTRVLTLRTGDN